MNNENLFVSRLLKYLGLLFLLLAVVLLLFLNRGLADFAELLYPGSDFWVRVVLMSLEAVALGWLLSGLYGRRRHLLPFGTNDPAQKKRFALELARRLASNQHLKAAGLSPYKKVAAEPKASVQRAGPAPEAAMPDAQAPAGGPHSARLLPHLPPDVSAGVPGLEQCLAFLRRKADDEIRQNARRVFLATALSQNGKLDALIVFVSLCRLIWRVSAIYNQRPHPREIVSLYGAVVSSTFLALSLEELDLSTEISVGFGESFNAMVPAGIGASIPFAGRILHTFTSSTLDGAANCYLALRAGVITRNAYAYGACLEASPSRRAVFKEAGNILLEMSQELVEKLAAALAANLAGAAKNAARYAGTKTVRAGCGVVESISRTGQGVVDNIDRAGQQISGSAVKIASGTVEAARNIGSGVGSAAGNIITGSRDAVNKAATLAARSFKKSGDPEK